MASERDTGIRRGLGALAALASPEAVTAGGLGVLRVAELLGKDKSQVSRTLKILAEEGFVDRDPRTLHYRLGWRFFTMAKLAGDRRLVDLAEPHLAKLVDELGESVYLSVLSGREALTVLAHAPEREVRAAAWTGRRVPVHSTSVGRVLLAGRTERQARLLLAGTAVSPDDLENLVARLATVRADGYCVVNGEFEPGLLAVAAPVMDGRGGTVAAINVSGPGYRLAARIDGATRAVASAAAALSDELTGPPQSELGL